MVFKIMNEAEYASFTMTAILVAASVCWLHGESRGKEQSFCIYCLVKMNMSSTLGSRLLAVSLAMLWDILS